MDMAVQTKGKKREKFRKLAEKRTNKAIDAIRLIGNLSNHQLYEWEEAEVKKILKALRDSLGEVEARFNQPGGRRGGDFKL